MAFPRRFGSQVRVLPGAQQHRSRRISIFNRRTDGGRWSINGPFIVALLALVATVSACTSPARRRDDEADLAANALEPTEAETAPADRVPPGKVISFEDESDRAYRRFVELHRPGAAP